MANSKGSVERMHILWKDYFKDPLLWCHNRQFKYFSGAPDLTSRIGNDSLWVEGCDNPFWVLKELEKRAMVTQDQIHSLGTRNRKQDFRIVEMLKDCAKRKDLYRGRKLHYYILKMGLLEKSLYIGNALISMYAKCGMHSKAQQVLEELLVQDTISWNSLIAGYAQHGKGHDALNCFERMQSEGFTPDEFTFTCILKACGSIGAIDKGKQIHDEIVDKGLLRKSIVLGNALVDMYARCGVLAKAKQVLDELPVRNVVCWSSLIAGYAQDGRGHEALECFDQMQREGFSPDEITFTCILKACGSIGAIDKGKQIHDDVVRRGLLKRNIVIGTALVDMYSKCGAPAKAHAVLYELPHRNVVSWSALIGGYIEEGKCHEALNCFERMQREGLYPNEFTFTGILKAVGCVGAIDKGKQIHGEIASRGFLEKNIVLGTALVDMYAKCGVLAKAQEVLEGLRVRDTVSWSALIAGYAEKGHCNEAFKCFEQMQREGLSPNDVTFLCVLNACSHSGKLDVAETYYEDMTMKYGITPKSKHHACMVVAFGGAGCFRKAMSMIKTLPSSSEDLSVRLALLSACKKWQNVNLGRLVFDQAFQRDHSLAAAYSLMANLYADPGMQDD